MKETIAIKENQTVDIWFTISVQRWAGVRQSEKPIKKFKIDFNKGQEDSWQDQGEAGSVCQSENLGTFIA